MRKIPASWLAALFAACSALFTCAHAGTFDWPQWGGPDRSNVSKETGLLKTWPEDGPKQVWLYRNAGSGYSGPAIVAGKLFTMGTRDNSEILIGLDANTGAELWTSKIGPILDNDWGNGPRGTPSVDGDRIYALGGKGDLVCASVADGKVLWRADMASLGGEIPSWGYTESPLVDGDRVVCTPGGSKGAVAALDKNSGKVLWQSAQFTDPAQYSSAILASPGGKRQYIQLTMKSLVGVSANDGKLLWKSDWPGRVAVIPTPIYHDDHVYITSGYGSGCKLVKLTDGSAAADMYENKVMKNHHGGVVQVGDHVYGHSDGTGWVCQDFKKGSEVWSEKKALGKGAITCADDRLYCLGEDDGTVVLVDASPKGWSAHGRFKLSPQTAIRKSQGRIWTHPVVSNGKLYLRDQDLIFCFEVAQR